MGFSSLGPAQEQSAVKNDPADGTLIASTPRAQRLPRRRRGKAKLPDTAPFSDLPEYLQDNEFITQGYRIDYSIRDTFTSLFRLHNETGNIWTHLIGEGPLTSFA